MQVSISFPTDEGYLRRRCCGCSREFKWLADKVDRSDANQYHCPYCDSLAKAGDWFTRAQRERIEATIFAKLQAPLDAEFDKLTRASRGAIKVTKTTSPMPRPLQEPADMRVVVFACHPECPLKVDERWTGPLHCLLCGETTLSTSPPDQPPEADA